MENKNKISVASPLLDGNEKKYVNDCLDSSWISSNGKYIKMFEESFAAYCDTKYALSCSNGTVALHLALLALGISEGDEVIIPTLTYVATANAVTYCGAKPLLIDSEVDTWNINPDRIEEKISNKTKAIIVVHLYGHPVNMDPIFKIAQKHGLYIIEDAAEAHGALYNDKKIGSLSDIAIFSFFGNKIITTGEGGMVVTNDIQLANKIRILKGQGMDPNRRYWFPLIGYNYRMTNIQAAIGLGQLENIDRHLENRKKVAKEYNKRLNHLREFIELPIEKDWATHSYWMYSILLKENVKISRDEFMSLMENEGIETRPIFYPMHILPPYKDNSDYPVADFLSKRGLNIPTHSLLNEENISYICKNIEKHLLDNI